MLLLLAGAFFAYGEEGYVGAQTCVGCHQSQAKAWEQSDHFKSMQPAIDEHVLADFNDVEITLVGRTTRFFTRQGEYFVETPDEAGKQHVYPVKFTFGYFPLQQYLLETQNGRLQAFDIAWDSRPAERGGQRWYQLQDAAVTDPEHPFFWTGYYQNWNARCASCHSTDFKKHYDADTGTYQSTWQDVNVGCESCHGPGAKHVALVQDGKVIKRQTGLKALAENVSFHFNSEDPIARPATTLEEGAQQALNVCGGCHSRRAELQAPDATTPYHDQFQLDLVTEPLYFNDGQIQDEVFVLGSFLQSKMAKAGVTCTHCHDPHTGKLRLPGAQVCSTCHRSDVFASPSHTNGHEDTDCLACHMPERTYMGVDNRRDHRFHRPSNAHPNSAYPCKTCHEDKSQAWFNNALENWPRREDATKDTLGHWARINQALADMDPDAVLQANQLLLAEALPSLLQVALADKMVTLAPSASEKAVFSLAESDDPVARRGAARSALALAEGPRNKVLRILKNDSAKSVRMEVANSLLSLTPDEQKKLGKTALLLNEYHQVLLAGQDHPGGNLGLAQMAMLNNDIVGAKEAFDRALAIDPSNIPALLNYADFLRNMGNAKGARAKLEKALQLGGDLAGVQYAFGLQLIREKAYQAAVSHLKKAASGEDATARFAFVYAVALWQTNNQAQAIGTLTDASTRWPGNYDILVTLAKYAYQQQHAQALNHAMSELAIYFPNDPVYQQLLPFVSDTP